MSKPNHNPWQKSSLDQWDSVKCSLREFVTTTTATSMNQKSALKTNFPPPTHPSANTHTAPYESKLNPSLSVSSFCPSLTESTSTQQSQSSSPHTNNTPPLQSFPSRKPIKSAMKKSSGSYGMKQGGKAPLHPSQCIPSGMDGGSIVMPSGGGYQQPQQHQLQLQHQQPHHAGANGANGYISPQYGWYISMTPPTPPHFHESSSNSDGNNKNDESYNNTQYQTLQQQYHFHNPKNKGNGFSTQNEQLLPPLQQYQQSSLTQTSINNKNIGKFPKAGQDAIAARPIFTRSLKGVPNNTSGWPSVPL